MGTSLAAWQGELHEKRKDLSAYLKAGFIVKISECPCCHSENRDFDIGFWYQDCSSHCPKWTVRCNSCSFVAHFWASSATDGVQKFRQEFRAYVARRLQGRWRPKQKKNS